MKNESGLTVYQNVLETYWYIKSKQFSNKDDAFNALKTIEKDTQMIKELRELVLEKQYLHTTDLRIKLERILGKQNGDSVE